MLVLSLLVAPIVMTNNLCARRTLSQKGRVIYALLMAYSVFSHLSPLPCMELPRVVMCLCFSGIAFIAHKVTKNVYLSQIQSHNVIVVSSLKLSVYSNYHLKADVTI